MTSNVDHVVKKARNTGGRNWQEIIGHLARLAKKTPGRVEKAKIICPHTDQEAVIDN
jgi:hypothetical protein